MTKYFLVESAEGIGTKDIEKRLKKLWQPFSLDTGLDAILRQVMTQMNMFPMVADRIVLNLQTSWTRDEAAYFEAGTIHAHWKRFDRGVLEHECAHVVFDLARKTNLSVSRKVEEVVACWVDEAL